MLNLGSFVWFSVICAAAAYLEVDIHKAPKLIKRGAGAAVSLDGDGLAFHLQFEIGGQRVSGQLDTASSDIWVLDEDGCGQSYASAPSCQNPYDPNKSSTLTRNNTHFETAYADGTGAQGYFAQDTIGIEGFDVHKANFAVASKANTGNVFGIGSVYTESCVQWAQKGNFLILDTTNGCEPYTNLPIQMKQQGLISSVSYSIWLRSDGMHGSLQFGGLDRGCFTGKMTIHPMQRLPYGEGNGGKVVYYPAHTLRAVELNAISVNNKPVLTESITAILDYGSTVCMLPMSLATQLGEIFGTSSDNNFRVPCNAGNQVFTFTFGDAQFQVPAQAFIKETYKDSKIARDKNGNPICALGMMPSEDNQTLLLGDNILSSLYVVIDWERFEVGLASSSSRSGDGHVTEIDNGILAALGGREKRSWWWDAWGDQH